jgi:hypothetical protein
MTIKFTGDYTNRAAIELAVRSLYQTLEMFDKVAIYLDQKEGDLWIESVLHRFLRASGYDRYQIFIGSKAEPAVFSRLIQIQSELSD